MSYKSNDWNTRTRKAQSVDYAKLGQKNNGNKTLTDYSDQPTNNDDDEPIMLYYQGYRKITNSDTGFYPNIAEEEIIQ